MQVRLGFESFLRPTTFTTRFLAYTDPQTRRNMEKTKGGSKG